MFKLKLRRLSRIVNKMCGRIISINISTSLPEEVYAVVKDNWVVVNGYKCKTVPQIIIAVAHEITHELYPDLQDNTIPFEEKWKEVEDSIKNQYGDLDEN